MMKRYMLLVAMILMATNVWAVKTMDVSATKHNMSATSPFPEFSAVNEGEVCVFCHTPHGGSLDAPLWNRTMPNDGTGFTHYTSITLSSYFTGKEARPVSTESLLCLSCHDGTVAIGTLINNSNTAGAAPALGVMFDTSFGLGVSKVIGDGPAANPGKDLSNDHPISFSYYDALLVNGSKLNPVGGGTGARDKGIRFFGADAALGQRVECSSCHDPHVNGNADYNFDPFLVMSNTGSALCLACHNK